MNDTTKKAFSKNDLKYFTQLNDSAELNSVDNAGRTLLFLAIMKGKKDVSSILLGKELNFDIRANDGRSLIYIAAQFNESAIIEKLAAKGVAIDAPDKLGLTPLMLATQCASNKAVRKLIELGANVNAVAPSGTTVLSECASHDNVEAFEMLLKAGANPHLNSNITLFRYVYADAVNLIKAFINLKPNLDLKNVDSFSNTLARKGSPEEENSVNILIHFLIENGYDLSHKDNVNRSIAWYLAFNRHYEPLVYLAKLGYRMDEGDLLDETPQTIVKKNGAPKAVQDALHGSGG